MSRLRPLLPFLALALGACGDSVAPKGPVANITAAGGDGQTAAALDTVPEELVVQVVDDEGRPLAGVPVSWSTSAESGRVLGASATTDTDGRARASWVLGLDAGAQQAEARAVGFDGAARFSATADALVGFKAIALMRGVSGEHMCALAADSLAWCWGDNWTGQLGDGTATRSDRPRKVSGDIRFASIYGTWGTTCGLTAGGALWCWGQNERTSAFPGGGIFGNGTVENSSVPVRAAPDLVLAAFDMDGDVACGVTTGGRGYCWGAGGALGNGGATAYSSIPVEIVGDRTWREIAVGDDRRCAVDASWEVYCWAEDHLDRWTWVGVHTDAGPEDTPLHVGIVSGLTHLTSSWYNQCGLSLGGAGTAVCWGDAYTGEDPFTPPGPTVVQLPGVPIRSVISEGETGVALDTSGRLWAWGVPPSCCDGFISSSPVRIKPSAPWLDVSIALGFHVVLARDSTVIRLDQVSFPYDGSPLRATPVPLPE